MSSSQVTLSPRISLRVLNIVLKKILGIDLFGSVDTDLLGLHLSSDILGFAF